MTTVQIDVATQFSRFPMGRSAIHGPYNAQRFKDELLLPALSQSDHVIVILTGTLGVSPSFLDEAFGTLVEQGFTPRQLRRRLVIKTDSKLIRNEIWLFIENHANAQHLHS